MSPLTTSAESTLEIDGFALPLGGRGAALVLRLLQLRRPPGGLLRLPAAEGRVRPQQRAEGADRLGVHAGVRPVGPAGGIRGGPGVAASPDRGRAGVLEPRLRGHGAGAHLQPVALLPRGRGAGRDVLFPRVHVAPGRLPRAADPLACHEYPPDERLRRDGTGRDRGGLPRGERYGWRSPFWVLGLVGLAYAGWLASQIVEPVRSKDDDKPDPGPDLARGIAEGLRRRCSPPPGRTSART